MTVLVVVHVSFDRPADDAMEINLFEVLVGDVLGFFAQHGSLDHLMHDSFDRKRD